MGEYIISLVMRGKSQDLIDAGSPAGISCIRGICRIKIARGAKVVAIEKNPEAFGWLSVNLELNRVSSQVQSFCDDAVHIPDLVSPGFDRVISPTPYGLDPILNVLASVTRKGGWIHFSTFKSKREVESSAGKIQGEGPYCKRLPPVWFCCPGDRPVCH